MKYLYSLALHNALNVENLNRILPPNFKIAFTDQRINIEISPVGTESDEEILMSLRRELDRITFFVGHYIECKYEGQILDDGTISKFATIGTHISTMLGIPEKLTKQHWDNEIQLQLYLWRLTRSNDIPYSAKINLLFQIIEISHPDRQDTTIYPEYLDSTTDPSPLTECKLLRDLVSHGWSAVTRTQLTNYCAFLGVPAAFHNPTNSREAVIIRRRLGIIEGEANKIIRSKLTYSSA